MDTDSRLSETREAPIPPTPPRIRLWQLDSFIEYPMRMQFFFFFFSVLFLVC